MTPCSNCQEPGHTMQVGDEQWCLVCVMDRSTSCSECLQLCDRYSPQVYEITNKGDTYFVESACLVKWAAHELLIDVLGIVNALTADMEGRNG